jgi:AAHS family 4-hydroxybenzoate transporter-like MFS transporter
MASRSVSVSEVFDASRFTAYQYLVCSLSFLVVLFDGFDLTVAGVALPKIADFLHAKPSALGLAVSASQFGPVIGALLLGTLADRFGRKPMLLLSGLIFAVFTGLTVTITSVEYLALYRFFAGLGLGGAVPIAFAFGSEYAPSRVRSTLIATMYAGVPTGAMIGGLSAAWLIPHFGWQSLFVLGAVVPIVICVIMAMFLPESLEFLVRRSKDKTRIRKIVSRISPALGNDQEVRFVSGGKKLPGVPVKHLFMEGRAPATIVWWIICFLATYMVWILVFWATTLLRKGGATVVQYSLGFAAIMLGNIVAAVFVGRLMDKVNPYRVLQIGFVLAFVALTTFGLAVGSHSLVVIVLASFVCGLFINGAQAGVLAAATTAYPPAIRGTGIGWAYAVAKMGGVVAPAVGGILLSMQWGVAKICFWQALIGLFITALFLVMQGRLARAAQASKVAEREFAGAAG